MLLLSFRPGHHCAGRPRLAWVVAGSTSGIPVSPLVRVVVSTLNVAERIDSGTDFCNTDGGVVDVILVGGGIGQADCSCAAQ